MGEGGGGSSGSHLQVELPLHHFTNIHASYSPSKKLLASLKRLETVAGDTRKTFHKIGKM